MTEHDPKLITALGHHMFALEVAIERLSKATKKPVDGLFQSILTEGMNRLSKMPPEALQEMMAQMLQEGGGEEGSQP
ncbi:hypothetical protein [Egbenema bharatensis]|uniref:hypothetical protein n=1 Tax=Egbenema bharatensis TaxID=3463334 RepID=UPI003A85D8F6